MASNEEILLQFTAEDEISSVVSDIESAVSSSISAIIELMGDVDNSIEQIVSNVEILNEAFEDMAVPELNFDIDTTPVEEAQEMVNELSQDVSFSVSVDSSEIDQAVSSKEELNQDTYFTANSEGTGGDDDGGDDFGTIMGAVGAYEVGNFGMDALERAGRVQDSWNRLELTFKNTGVSIDELKEKSQELSDTTGKSGSAVREWFNAMGVVGVTNTNLLSDAFTSMTGRAYQTGTSIENVESSVQRMALTGNAGARFLSRLGLSTKQLADAMGVSEDKLTETFKGLSVDERLQALTKAMGDGTEANEMYKTSLEGLKERGNIAMGSLMVSIGKPILEAVIPMMEQVVNALKMLGDGFKALPSPVQKAVAGVVAGAAGLTTVAGVLPIFTKAIGGFKSGFELMGNYASKLPGIGNKFSSFGKKTEEVVKTASGTGKLAGEASKAGVGMQTTSVSLKGIGQGALSMVAPMLEIALAVAILLPVVAAIVAEAMLLLKGLQLLLDALDFDSIDLTKTIESLKQLGVALFEIGVAMGALTFASLMTTLSLAVSGLTQLLNPIKLAGDMLINVGAELQRFSNVKIDSSIPEKIKSISESIGLVAKSMMDLTNLTLTMVGGNILTLGGLLGDISTAIKTARKEITLAGEEIAKFKDVPEINEENSGKLEKIGTALEGVAKAFDSLRSIRDNYNWDSILNIGNLFGGADIETALNNVKQDIIKAGNSLSSFSNLPELPEEIGTRLQGIAKSLESVASAMQSLSSIKDTYNWNQLFDGILNIFGGADIQTSLLQVRTVLTQSATILATFTTIPEIPEGLYTKVTRVADGTKVVGNAISVMNGVTFPDIVSLLVLPEKIRQAGGVIQRSSVELNKLTGIQAIPDGLYTKVSRVGISARNLGVAVKNIQTVPPVGAEVVGKIRNGVSAVKSTALELNKLQGTAVGANIGQILSSVSSAVSKLRTSLNAMRGGFRSSGVGIGSSLKSGVKSGLNGLSGVVRGSVSSAVGSGRGVAGSGGSSIGSAMTRGFGNAFKIANVVRNEMSYSLQAIQGSTSSLVGAIGSLAQQMVDEAKSKFDQQSPGKIARMMGAEMDYGAQLINTRGRITISAVGNVAQRIVGAFSSNWTNPMDIMDLSLNSNNINGLRAMTIQSEMGKQQRPINITIGEGAIQLDARNMTEKESRQILINALEGLDMINSIDIRGV